MEETATVVDKVANTAPKTNWWYLLLYCVIILAFIYIFMIYPNKKRMAEYQKMLNSLKVGSKVVAAGIYGTVKEIKEKTIMLEIADDVVIEVNKNAVSGVE